MKDPLQPVGCISMAAAFFGLVIPVALGLVFIALGLPRPLRFACVLALVAAQLVALICGVIARRTPPGRMGMLLSALCLAITAASLALLFIAPSASPAP